MSVVATRQFAMGNMRAVASILFILVIFTRKREMAYQEGTGHSRRSFLRLSGMFVGATVIAGCWDWRNCVACDILNGTEWWLGRLWASSLRSFYSFLVSAIFSVVVSSPAWN